MPGRGPGLGSRPGRGHVALHHEQGRRAGWARHRRAGAGPRSGGGVRAGAGLHRGEAWEAAPGKDTPRPRAMAKPGLSRTEAGQGRGSLAGLGNVAPQAGPRGRAAAPSRGATPRTAADRARHCAKGVAPRPGTEAEPRAGDGEGERAGAIKAGHTGTGAEAGEPPCCGGGRRAGMGPRPGHARGRGGQGRPDGAMVGEGEGG